MQRSRKFDGLLQVPPAFDPIGGGNAHADRLVREFGSLQGLLAASSSDLEAVEGIGAIWARQVREGLSHLAESTIADPLG